MSSGSIQLQLRHLSQAAKVLDSGNRTQKLLQSYYLSRLQRIACAGNITIEQQSNTSCDQCFSCFSNASRFSLSIKPLKIHRKKYNKLVAELESNDDLSTCKTILAKKYQKLVHNIAVTTCNLCKSTRKTEVRFIDKNNKKLRLAPPDDLLIIQPSELELVKPKKRKQDKYAGLKINDKVPNSPSILKIKPKVQTIKVTQTKLTSNNRKTSKNSSCAVKKVKNISQAEKQRKNILLLANVLKMNDQKQTHSNIKLSNMFKK